MPDYSLGRAHGKIDIDYDGGGAGRAARDLDSVTKSSTAADASLTKTGKTLKDTDRQLETTGNRTEAYSARLRDVRRASDDVDVAQRHLNDTLLDSKATVDDINDAYERLNETRKRHTKAVEAERDAHRALRDGSSGLRGALSSLSGILPDLESNFGRLRDVQHDVTTNSGRLSSALGTVATVVGFLGPQGKAAAGGLLLASEAIDKVGNSASASSNFVTSLVKGIAGFEVAVGKVSGLALGGTALGGLTGIGGAAGVQGLVNVAGAARQLTGVLGLLPAMGAGVAAVMSTLQVAFQGVDAALQNMMSDDPQKFLEAIANMAPAAAQSMLQIAQFRDQFKLAGGAVQESFFSKIVDDIAPLIQTWLPALTSAGSQIAGVLGSIASQVAQIVNQPEMVAAFGAFIDNINAGLQAMAPALGPLIGLFTQLAVIGSSFFEQIGGSLTQAVTSFADMVNQATASGELQQWIQTGINAFGHLGNIIFQVGSAFNTIMNVADQFGGGGLLGWLDQLSGELAKWTQSAEGQSALTGFFTALRQATDAFMPLLSPLMDGLISLGSAFVQLGTATAPGWLGFFNGFSSAMAQLGPHIVSLAPAINQFLINLGASMVRIVQTVGPKLPMIFEAMSNAFVALLPQIPPLIEIFGQLVERVGPQLPKLFEAVTGALTALIPLMPTIIGFIRNFVSAVTMLVDVGTGVIKTLAQFADGIVQVGNAIWELGGKAMEWGKKFLKGIGDTILSIPGKLGQLQSAIGGFFAGLSDKAVEWGKNILLNLIKGIGDSTGISSLLGTLGNIGGHIVDFFKTSSPARRGPLHDISPNEMGARVVRNFAAGMVSAQGAVESASGTTAAAVAGGMAPAASGAEGVAGALLPPWIAGADTSILSAYLRHSFDENRGLKGLANDMGKILQAAQSGFNLLTQGVMTPMFSALGMVPGLNAQRWTKMSPEQFAAQQQQEAERKAAQDQAKQGPTWQDVLGPGASPGGAAATSPSSGDSQLAAALKRKGFSAEQIRLIQGFSEVEGNNPAGNPTLGFTDAQLGGASDLESHVDALAKQFIDRAPVAGQFPEGGSDEQQAQWIAKVVGQAGLSSDWQGNAQPKDYVQRVVAAMPPLGPPAPGEKGPTWAQVTGGTAPSAPTAAPSGTYGLPKGTDTGGYGTGNAKTFPDWVMALADRFGVKPSTYAGHQESDRHEAGYAPNPERENRGIDWAAPMTAEGIANMQRFADYLATIPGALEQVIWENPNTGQRVGVAGGKINQGYYPAGTYADHRNHVHTRQSSPIPLPDGSVVIPPPGSSSGVGSSAAAGANITLPSGKPLAELLDNSAKTASTNDKLLDAYLQGNPALAQQIDAAKTPGADDQTVLGTLASIDTTINSLKTQDAVANKNAIAALQSTQNQIAQGAGFQQSPSGLSVAQSIASGAGGAVTSVFQAIQGGLDSIAATQDIADRLVYGLRNTEDVMAIIDNVQKYITFAAQVASATGNILSTIGGLVGAGGSGDASGGSQGASMALSAAGQIAQLIAAALQGVNMAIDYGQELYRIAGSYVGQFLSYLTAGIGGTPLMGDVRMLLNKNTGQLVTYSEDNPGNKNTLNVPSWMNSTYDYGGGQNPNPQVNTQWNIYAGPGQSPGEMLNETMWMVNTQGTTGAMASANF